MSLPDIPEDFSKRYGRVRVSKFLVDDNPRAVMAAFSDAIVIRCEFMYPTADLEYWLCRADFDPVPMGQTIPDYDLLFTMHADRTVTHEWKKR